MGQMREHIVSLVAANASPAVGMMEFPEEVADKIIEAMRQASPDMIKAEEDAVAKTRSRKRKVGALEIWQAMIDAA